QPQLLPSYPISRAGITQKQHQYHNPIEPTQPEPRPITYHPSPYPDPVPQSSQAVRKRATEIMSQKGAGAKEGVFAGKSFFVSVKVPSRHHYIGLIKVCARRVLSIAQSKLTTCS